MFEGEFGVSRDNRRSSRLEVGQKQPGRGQSRAREVVGVTHTRTGS